MSCQVKRCKLIVRCANSTLQVRAYIQVRKNEWIYRNVDSEKSILLMALIQLQRCKTVKKLRKKEKWKMSVYINEELFMINDK